MRAPSAPHHQLQYLEAMGLTVWSARYRLPHAAVTPACAWPEAPTPSPQAPPSQRLHSLIDDAVDTPAPHHSATTPATPVDKPSPAPARMREMLSLSNSPAPVNEPASVAPAKSMQQALSFTMQIAALDQRWLIVLAQPHAPTETEQRFLRHLLTATGILPNEAPQFLDFQWPMIKGIPVEDPVIEAQQGMRAFLEGRREAGWSPERLLMFGDTEHRDRQALECVLQLQNTSDEASSSLLKLPVWQSESLATLMSDADHKRALWPRTHMWMQWWN